MRILDWMEAGPCRFSLRRARRVGALIAASLICVTVAPGAAGDETGEPPVAAADAIPEAESAQPHDAASAPNQAGEPREAAATEGEAAEPEGGRAPLAAGDEAKDSHSPPPAEGEAAAAPPPAAGGPGGGPPPLPVLLGIAEFLIVIDRPYDAARIYQGILAHDPENPAARKGLAEAKRAQQPTWTALSHYYEDSHDVRLFAYGAGPTYRTPYGRVTFTVGTGQYRNDNRQSNARNPLANVHSSVDDGALSKQTVNLLLEPYYGKYEGYFFLSQVLYDGAPNRFLYDTKLTYAPDPARKRYTLTLARRDSFLQSDKNEFFAPESYWAVASGLRLDELSANIEYPVAKRLDFSGYYAGLDYADGNEREIYRSQLLYRLQPRGQRPMPIFRVGLGHTYDNTKAFAPYYYSPQHVHAGSLVADYVFLSKGLKFGLFGSYPIVKDRGTGFAKHDPARTLFGFVNYKLSDQTELYLKGGAISSPGYDLSFRDIVFGLNGRF